jgi:hypothetical protein
LLTGANTIDKENIVEYWHLFMRRLESIFNFAGRHAQVPGRGFITNENGSIDGNTLSFEPSVFINKLKEILKHFSCFHLVQKENLIRSKYIIANQEMWSFCFVLYAITSTTYFRPQLSQKLQYFTIVVSQPKRYFSRLLI